MGLKRGTHYSLHDKRKHNVWRRRWHIVKPILLTFLLAILVALSSLFHNVVIGQIAIGIYGLIAIIFKIPSKTTFKMVFVALLAIPLLTVFRPGEDLADTFAVYAYLLIAVGMVSALFEFGRTKVHKSKKVM